MVNVAGRVARALVLWVPLLAVLAVVYGRSLAPERTFMHRDAGPFYYPLFKLVTDQWTAGQVPLWNMMENGGQPLAANPAASVFYPAKVLFFLIDYPTAYKLYTLLHVVLCFWTMFALCRHWRCGAGGATVGALAYTFGGYVLFVRRSEWRRWCLRPRSREWQQRAARTPVMCRPPCARPFCRRRRRPARSRPAACTRRSVRPDPAPRR